MPRLPHSRAIGAAPSHTDAAAPAALRFDDGIAVTSSVSRSTHEQAPAAARSPAHPLAAAATLIEPAVIEQPVVKHDALALSAPAHPVRAKPRALRVVALDVEGSLPRSEIERAVTRALPALRGCRIGEPRRRRAVHD